MPPPSTASSSTSTCSSSARSSSTSTSTSWPTAGTALEDVKRVLSFPHATRPVPALPGRAAARTPRSWPPTPPPRRLGIVGERPATRRRRGLAPPARRRALRPRGPRRGRRGPSGQPDPLRGRGPQSGSPAPTGHDKTSIVCFQSEDRPGSLHAILGEFAARSINLTKLESRPTKQGLGDYCFLIDLEGHLADEVVADCLRVLHAELGGREVPRLVPGGRGPRTGRARARPTRRGARPTQWIRSLRRRSGAILSGATPDDPGGMAERTNARLLKSLGPQGSVGSNPTPSARCRNDKRLCRSGVVPRVRSLGQGNALIRTRSLREQRSLGQLLDNGRDGPGPACPSVERRPFPRARCRKTRRDPWISRGRLPRSRHRHVWKSEDQL